MLEKMLTNTKTTVSLPHAVRGRGIIIGGKTTKLEQYSRIDKQ